MMLTKQDKLEVNKGLEEMEEEKGPTWKEGRVLPPRTRGS